MAARLNLKALGQRCHMLHDRPELGAAAGSPCSGANLRRGRRL